MPLIVFPQAGHGPQHQYPEACVEYITMFIRTTESHQTPMPKRSCAPEKAMAFAQPYA
jgi:hypothetical protein